MSDDPRIEPRRKLVCVTCGEWILAHRYGDAWYCSRCGGSMIETYRDPAFLDLDLALKKLGLAFGDAFRSDNLISGFRRLFRRWRRTDA